MGVYTRYPGRFNYGLYFPPAIKWLLIVNCGLFLFSFFLGLADRSLFSSLVTIFGLRATGLLGGMIWQPLTYMFFHAGFGHLVFNMLALWMFGADLERDWGTRRFLRYYLMCGIGAGFCDVVMNLAFSSGGISTIGASGAIYGVLLAFGLLYPTRTVLFSFILPIPARIFVIIVGVGAFLSSLGGPSTVSNVAHLGGMLFGYLYLRMGLHYMQWSAVIGYYQQWRRRRLQQKFRVYMRKNDQDRGPWVN